MFKLTSNWLMIPEILYLILYCASLLFIVISIISLIISYAKKRTNHRAKYWITLCVSTIIFFLLANGSIIASTMVGG